MGGWVSINGVVKSSDLFVRSVLVLDVGWDVDPDKVWPEFEAVDLGYFLQNSFSVVLHGEGDLIAGGVELPVHNTCEEGFCAT